MSVTQIGFWIGFLQIVGIDLLLSGDNAVVIALACRNVPRESRRLALLAGAGAAVGIRIIFAFFVFELLLIPYVKLLGGLLLLWVGAQVSQPRGAGTGQAGGETDPAQRTSIWKAVWTIVLADAVMSLDNVVAIAGAARGSQTLLVLGLAISIPLVISGSALMLRLIDRFPVVITLGAGLVGWVAGDMIAEEPVLQGLRAAHESWFPFALPIMGIVIAVAGSRLIGRKGGMSTR